MKKWLILCMAMVLSLALLAGCDSADPNNPYGQEARSCHQLGVGGREYLCRSFLL